MNIDELKDLKSKVRKWTYPLTVISFLIGGISLIIEMIIRWKE